MAKRILKNTLFVVFTVILLCGICVLAVVYNYYNAELTKGMYDETNYIAEGVEHSGYEYLDNMYDAPVRITWISSDGIVLYDNRADISTMDNHADRQEFKDAQISSKGTSVRFSNTLSEKTVYYAVRLSDRSVVRVSHTQNSIFVLVLKMMQPMIFVILLAFVLSGLLTHRLAKQIISPLDKIDLDHPEESEVYEEMSPFVRKIVVQNRQIQESMSELRKQKNEFELVTKNMQEGLILIDNNAKVLSCNDSALKMFSVDFEVEQKSVLSINRSEEFGKSIDAVLGGVHDEIVMYRGECCYNVYMNPVFNEEKVVGAIIIVTDVTEKEEREKLRREFSANVSHELKTPLTAISGTAEILKNGIVANEDVPKFAGNIYDESKRLISLVEDIIKVSQLDENKILPDAETIDLCELAQRVVKNIEPIAKDKGISVEFSGEQTFVTGVATVLEEMIYNLCDNAIKYNKENGKIFVSIEKNADGKNVLSVEDTGIGIAKEHHERIFERFYRVDKSHSKEIGGTGLGLSIVKHGAKIHNARLVVDSTLGNGTVISLVF